MRALRLMILVFSVLAGPSTADSALKLKPGFYPGGEHGSEALSRLRATANLHLSLSWHAGISFGEKSNLTLRQLKKALEKIERKSLASVMLEKNYIDKKLHLEVEKLLLESGFKAVLITGAHSSGIQLEKYTVKDQGVNPGKGSAQPQKVKPE